MSNKIKIMFYADSYKATSGYGKVVQELSKRLAYNPKYDISIQQIVSSEPAYIAEQKIKVLPSYGQRGSDIFLSSIINNLRILSPDIFIPICDPFLLTRDKLDNIEYVNMKLMPYIPLDSIGIPDLSRPVLEKASHIFAMSYDAKKQLDKEGYKQSSVLYHGVDTNKYKPNENNKNRIKKKLGLNDEDKVFLVMGRNFTRKRHFRLFESIARLNKYHKYNNIKFFCHISDAEMHPINLKEFINRLEKKYDVKLDNIIFTDTHKLGSGINETDIIEYFQMADYYISASGAEGFGLCTVEAMACKTLPILGNGSNSEELLGENEERGLLAGNCGFQNTGYGTQQPLVDIDHLKEKIIEAIEMDKIVYEEKTNNALQFIKEKCNWDLIALQIQQVIENGFK